MCRGVPRCFKNVFLVIVLLGINSNKIVQTANALPTKLFLSDIQ